MVSLSNKVEYEIPEIPDEIDFDFNKMERTFKYKEQEKEEKVKNLTEILGSISTELMKSEIFECFKEKSPIFRLLKYHSTTIQWASTKGWQCFSKEKNSSGFPLSHGSFGMEGWLSIPYKQIAIYRKYLASDILDEKLFYLCELPIQNKIKFAIDIDYESPENIQVSWKTLYSLILLIVKEVNQFFPNLPSSNSVYICISLPKTKIDNGQSTNRYGLHFYFNEIIIGPEICGIIRSYLIEQCVKQFSSFSSSFLIHGSSSSTIPTTKTEQKKFWEKCIDPNIPTHGLRLIFARRPIPCLWTPKNKKKCIQCSTCGGSKGIPSDSFYIPFLIFTNGVLDLKQTKSLHEWQKNKNHLPKTMQLQYLENILAKCSIRPYFADKEENDILITEPQIPADAIFRSIPLKRSKVNKQKDEDENRTKVLHPSSFASTVCREGKKYRKLPPSSIIYSHVREVFQQNIFGHIKFLNLNITEVLMNSQGSSLTIHTDEKFCLKKGSEHKNHGVYFVMKKKEERGKRQQQQQHIEFVVVQRCHCPHSPCREYESIDCRIPPELSNKIFKLYLDKIKEQPIRRRRYTKNGKNNMAVSQIYFKLKTNNNHINNNINNNNIKDKNSNIFQPDSLILENKFNESRKNYDRKEMIRIIEEKNKMKRKANYLNHSLEKLKKIRKEFIEK